MKVFTSVHCHSCVTSLPAHLSSFLPEPQGERGQADIKITLIWKDGKNMIAKKYKLKGGVIFLGCCGCSHIFNIQMAGKKIKRERDVASPPLPSFPLNFHLYQPSIPSLFPKLFLSLTTEPSPLIFFPTNLI